MGVVDLDRAAPGPVSAVHALAFEAEDVALDECSACHGGWFESMASACADCHEEVLDDMETEAGLHGGLPGEVEAEACGTCHGEHNGPGFQLAGPRSFKLAGAGTRDDFDHAVVGFDFEGAHLELDCVECHTAADELVLEPDQQRFRGLDQDCASCHTNDHAPVFPQDCTSCHNESDWTEQSWTEHAAFFPRQGAHAEAGCRDCHAADSPVSLEARLGRRGGGLPEVRGCTACHEAPHSESFLAGSLEPGADCSVCHETSLGSFETATERLEPAAHDATGYGLDAPHDQLECTACHAPVGQFIDRFPGRQRSDCVACHEDPHGEQFAADQACIDCHRQDAFEPHLFDADRHAVLALALSGAHGEADCAECHQPLVDAGEALAFRGTDATCAACHTDAHAGFDFAGEAPDDCASCHDDVAFPDARAGFGHGLRTGFELEGAHGEESCESCHLPAAEPDAAGRRFGRVALLLETRGALSAGSSSRVANQDCGLCHVDVHAGVFARSEELASCGACHSPLSFRTGLDDFDHAETTGFSLGGGHAELDCTACHADDSDALRGRAPAAGADCASCHDEPHGGQFAPSPRGADCARCHAPEAPFVEPHFDHDVDSDFPLEGRHRELACTECHALEDAGGTQLRRYWPLERDCTACHGVVEGGRLRRSSGRTTGGTAGL
jgi:hypothetical protein